jgi:glycerophosphoryl diester phosphodiesterase
MTRLGYRNPLRRLVPILGGLARAPAPEGSAGRPVQVVGHRGAPRERPENTIASFERAFELGGGAIETDLCVTRDGAFILWHDADPDDLVARARQAGAEKLFCRPEVPPAGSPWRKPVRELDLGDLRGRWGYSRREISSRKVKDAGSVPEFPVATLEELLAFARGEPRLRHVYLDVKLAADQTGSAGKLVNVLRAGRVEGISFHLLSPQREIAQIFLDKLSSDGGSSLDAYPDFELPGALDFARRLRARKVSMGGGERWWRGFLPELARVVAARDSGELDSVVVWTFNEASRLEELVRLGVDGILTDDVLLLCGLARKAGRPQSGAEDR